MRLESLSSEEGVTAGERRGTAIRAFLKGLLGPPPHPPTSLHARAHTHTHTKKPTHIHRLNVNMQSPQCACPQTHTQTCCVQDRHMLTPPFLPSRLAHCHSNGSPETTGHTGHGKVCPPALVIYTIESTLLFNPSSLSLLSSFLTCRNISLDLKPEY